MEKNLAAADIAGDVASSIVGWYFATPHTMIGPFARCGPRNRKGNSMLGETDQETPPFEIFRATAAVDYAESGPMHAQPFSDIELEGSQRLADAGFLGGSKVKLLYSRPGMSLTYLWFKSGFPLPRHSHDADCLYFIVAGSIRLGNQELSPGDGFFLGSNVPYSYVPGAEGVELLEFRTSDTFDFKMQANNKSYWDKALASLLVARERWADETAPPSGMTIGAG